MVGDPQSHPPPPPQISNCCRSCKVQGMIGEGEMEDDRGMVMEVEGSMHLGRIGMLSCMMAGIGGC